MLLEILFILIIFSERTWLEEGRKVGESVVPLARTFNGMSSDLESGSNTAVCILNYCF